MLNSEFFGVVVVVVVVVYGRIKFYKQLMLVMRHWQANSESREENETCITFFLPLLLLIKNKKTKDTHLFLSIFFVLFKRTKRRVKQKIIFVVFLFFFFVFW